MRIFHSFGDATNFDLYSALMAFEQLGSSTLNNSHLRGPVTLTPVAECLAVELSLPILTTSLCPDRGSNHDFPHARRTLYHYATAVLWEILNILVSDDNCRIGLWVNVKVYWMTLHEKSQRFWRIQSLRRTRTSSCEHFDSHGFQFTVLVLHSVVVNLCAVYLYQENEKNKNKTHTNNQFRMAVIFLDP